MARRTRKTVTQKAADAASLHLVNAERRILKLQAQIEALRVKAAAGSWDAVGSLGHVSETLGELVGEIG